MRIMQNRFTGSGGWRRLVCLVALIGGCGSFQGQDGVRESSEPSTDASRVSADTGLASQNSADEPEMSQKEDGPAEPPDFGQIPDAAIPLGNAEQYLNEGPDEAVPLYGVAQFFSTVIFAEPFRGASRMAYFRKGTVFRLRQVDSTSGCKGGWYAVVGGGYVCSGRGVTVSATPVEHPDVLPSADLDAPLPHEYRVIRRDGVMSFRRLPSLEQVEAIQVRLQIDDEDGADGIEEASMAWPSVVHMPLDKGFHVSVTDRRRWRSGVRYQQTLRGNYIRIGDLGQIRPSSLEGRELGPEETLPLVFVFQRNAEKRSLSPDGERWISSDKVPRYSVFSCLGEQTRAGQRVVKVGENEWIRSRAVRRAEPVSPPERIGPRERWIAVNLTEQTLVAYEGERPVFATLVTTGKAGSRTPVGTWRVYYKHVTTTMDELEDEANRFSLEDVPWTQYYHAGYALHGAYWHDEFGRVRSRGCINLSPTDARRLFFWTGPQLLDGRHGQAATETDSGTLVFVHR